MMWYFISWNNILWTATIVVQSLSYMPTTHDKTVYNWQICLFFLYWNNNTWNFALWNKCAVWTTILFQKSQILIFNYELRLNCAKWSSGFDFRNTDARTFILFVRLKHQIYRCSTSIQLESETIYPPKLSPYWLMKDEWFRFRFVISLRSSELWSRLFRQFNIF